MKLKQEYLDYLATYKEGATNVTIDMKEELSDNYIDIDILNGDNIIVGKFRLNQSVKLEMIEMIYRNLIHHAMDGLGEGNVISLREYGNETEQHGQEE